MIAVRYTKKINNKLPSPALLGDMSRLLLKAYLATIESPRPDEDGTDPESLDEFCSRANAVILDEKRELTQIQAKTSTSIKTLAELICRYYESNEDAESAIKVKAAWPYDDDPTESPLDAARFFRAVRENGIDGVKVPLLKIVQRATEYAKKNSYQRVPDSIVLGYLTSYYASFDERFQGLFYPSRYTSLTTLNGVLFELSSSIAANAQKTSSYVMSATNVWLQMCMQRPVPSLLSDFLTKSRRQSGVNPNVVDDEHNPLEDEEYSLSEMCSLYVSDFMPQRYDMSKLETQQALELIVADAISPTAPASVANVIAETIENIDREPSELEDWNQYCLSVKESAMDVDSPIAYYPDAVYLSDDSREFVISLMGNAKVSYRELVGLAAFIAFLDEVLQGGAPDIVFPTVDQIRNAYGILYGDSIGKLAATTEKSLAKLMDTPLPSGTIATGNEGKVVPGNLQAEDIHILKQIRKLHNFGVPLGFQRVLLAHMITEGRSMVTMDDIIGINVDDNSIDATIMLANTIDPFVVHAGVDDEASIVFSIAEILHRRALLSLPMSEESSSRIYGDMLVCAFTLVQGMDDECCSESDNWLISACPMFFDPRPNVTFFIEQPQTLLSAMPASSTTGSYGSSGQRARRGRATANMTSDEILDVYTHDMVEESREGKIGVGIVGRDEEIELVETILSRKDKSNPMLLAPAGAGKTALVEAIAKRIADGTSTLPEGMTLRSFDLISLTADGCGPGVMADRLERICNAAAAEGAILFIDEIHMINSVGSGDFNAGNILKPCLAREGLHVIGATTEREYNYSIARDKALSRRFSTMHLRSLEFADIIRILAKKAPVYGGFHDVTFDDSKMSLMALLAQDYMSDRESPDRELDILDTSASIAAAARCDEVKEEHIIKAVSLLTSNKTVKTRHAIAKELTSESEMSDEHVDSLFPNVAGQMNAKRAIAKRINESKLDISVREKPRNIFMFVGESGVGKTYMASQMAPLLDAGEDDILTLSLGEYQDSASFTRLVGASPQYVGYNEGGVLTNFVKAHPGGIIVLDEIDKCHPDVQALFLGVFDSGKLRAGDGSVADCNSITFVCTANTGFGQQRRNTLGFSAAYDDSDQIRENVMESLKTTFGEPLIGRIDEIVIFENLTVDELVEICKINFKLLSEKLADRYDVDISQVYSMDNLERDAREKFGSIPAKELDARSAWAQFEKDIVPKAIALL